jgi:hypothetical protein
VLLGLTATNARMGQPCETREQHGELGKDHLVETGRRTSTINLHQDLTPLWRRRRTHPAYIIGRWGAAKSSRSVGPRRLVRRDR